MRRKMRFYVEAAQDGRPFFIIPWNSQYLIGTTDIRYTDDLDTIRASRTEVDYLLAETNRVFPGGEPRRRPTYILRTPVFGPLPYREKGPESAITRRHIIKVNRKIGRGLVSIIGGKLTTYRNLAEQTVDKLARILRRKLPPCRTRDTGLPGVWGQNEARKQLQATQMLSSAGIDRLIRLYGGRSAAIAELASGDAVLQEVIDKDRSLIAAEIVFTIREEFPATLTDIVFRRTMLGFNADQGRRYYRDRRRKLPPLSFGWSEEKKGKGA